MHNVFIHIIFLKKLRLQRLHLIVSTCRNPKIVPTSVKAVRWVPVADYGGKNFLPGLVEQTSFKVGVKAW